jgi:putative ABC transport system permease protein
VKAPADESVRPEEESIMNMQIALALRYLQGRRLRTILTTLSIVFGVMILFGGGTIIPSMSEMFHQGLTASAGRVDLTISSVSDSPLDAQQVDAVRRVSGIAQATGSLHENIVLPASLVHVLTPGKTVNSLTIVGLDPATAQSVSSFPLESGRFLTANDSNAILVPSSLAGTLGLHTGDTLTLPSAEGTTQFTVAGIVGLPMLPGSEEVYVSLAAAQKLLNQPGQINQISAQFAAGADRAKIEAAMRAQLGPDYSFTQADEGTSVFSNAINIGTTIFQALGILVLAMAGFIIFNTFRTIVAERRHDLGMLRALGATRRMVLGLMLAEGLLQGVVGTALGLVLGYGLGLLGTSALSALALQYFHRQVPPPGITPGNLILSVVLGIGVTVVSGILPARAATNVTPLEALRPATVSVQRHLLGRGDIAGAVILVLAVLTLLSGQPGLAIFGAILFLIALAMLAGALVAPLANLFSRLIEVIYAREGGIARGNVIRQPARAAVTASTVMISLTIILGTAGMMSSVIPSFWDYVQKSLGADYLIMPGSLVLSGGNVGAGPALADQVRSTPGIASVTTLRLAVTSVNGQSLQIVGIDPATYPQVSGLIFSAGNEQSAYGALGAGRAIIANGIFASANKVKVGDVLPLQTASGVQQYRVVAIGVDYLNAKISTAYISQANLATDFRQSADMMLMANRAVNADNATVHAGLQTLVDHYPAFTLFDSTAFRAQQKTTLDALGGVFNIVLLILIVPALIAMVNTLAISVLERRREIGMLRAVGSTRRQIMRMIQAESLLLAAIGTAFGILAGLFLGYGMTGAFGVAGFVLSYHFPLAGVLVALAAGLLLGILAASIPARQAAQLDIVTALHYE